MSSSKLLIFIRIIIKLMSLNNFKTNLLGEKLQITLQLQIKMNYLKNNLTKKAMGYCKT